MIARTDIKRATTAPTGNIFDIQRFCIHDGPGIRTTVFMKGCPLRCRWCHNPEGMASGPQLSFIEARCIGCGHCLNVCARHAHILADGRHVLLREKCAGCGMCAKECHAKALEIVGREQKVDDVIAEVLRDKIFYDTSGGGMTLSGGEPLMQIEFAEALLLAARNEEVHRCVETSGYCDWERIARVVPLVNIWLFDVKETDEEKHRAITGVSNGPVIKNLRRLDDAGGQTILRCPIVPGINDRDDHFECIKRLAGGLQHLLSVEVMPYHRLGEGKIKRFGLEQPTCMKVDAPSADQLAQWEKAIGPWTADSPVA